MRPGPVTCSPRWCPSGSGSPAPSTRVPSLPAAASPAGPGRRGMRPRPGTSSPRWCPCSSGSRAPSTRGTLDYPRQLARWTGEAGDAAGGPGPVRRAAARPRTGPGAEHPDTLGARANLAYWTARRETQPVAVLQLARNQSEYIASILSRRAGVLELMWDSDNTPLALGIASGPDRPDISVANEIQGSQTGSQPRQARGHARPRPATITSAQRHVRPRSATSSDATGVPPKQ